MPSSIVTPTGPVRWLLAPATEASSRGGAITMAALRITVGLLWLYNVAWKRPPDFGQDSGKGLYGFTKDAVEHPVFAPYSWIVENLVLPNFTAFGWMVLAAETTLAVMLLTGAWVRLAALIGVGQSLAIGLSVAQAPNEWPWSYWMLIGIHLVLVFGAAGAVFAVDAVRAADNPADRARRLSYMWGAITAVTGVVAVLMSMGDGLLAAKGARLGGPDFSISLGSYNLLGAIVLVAIGALLLAAARMDSATPALIAAGLAVAAAISIYAQLGWTDSTLGGTNTSAAFYLCATVIGAVASRRIGSRTVDHTAPAHA